MPPPLTQENTNRVVVPLDVAICATIFVVVTAVGALREGYGIDDWMQIVGPSDVWLVFHGRWLTHALSEYFFAGHYFPGFQLFVAFVAFFSSARLVSRYSALPAHRVLVTCLTFVIGVNHFYMVEVMIFSSHVATYAAAVAGSLFAFHLLVDACRRSTASKLGAVVVSGVLLSAALGIYQTSALAGGIIFSLVIMRPERFSVKHIATLSVLSFAATALALLLYFIALYSYQAATGIYEPPPGTPVGESRRDYFLTGVLDQYRYMHRILLDLHSLNSSWNMPEAPKWLQRFAALAIGGFVAAAVVRTVLSRDRPGGGAIAGLRIAAGAVLALFVLPILFLFVVDSFPAARVFGYIGFTYAAVAAVAATHLVRGTAGSLSSILARAAHALMLGIALGYAWLAAAVWDDRARIDDRNRAIAHAIFARVSSLEGYNGEPFAIYGRLNFNDLSWGGPVGYSAFAGEGTVNAIFAELYNLPWTPLTLAHSPAHCPAFPHHDSVFLHEGHAIVCLEAFE